MVPNAQPIANGTHAETLLERAVKRHLAVMDRAEAARPAPSQRMRDEQGKLAASRTAPAHP